MGDDRDREQAMMVDYLAGFRAGEQEKLSALLKATSGDQAPQSTRYGSTVRMPSTVTPLHLFFHEVYEDGYRAGRGSR